MQRVWIGAAVVIAALIAGISTQASFDAQRQSEPPHAKPGPAPGRPGSQPDYLMAVADWRVAAEYATKEWERAQWIAAEEARLAAEEAARLEAARRAPVTPAPRVGTSVSGSWPTSLYPCGGDLPPCWVAQRESGGNYSAVNWSGCGGRSCGGKWQFDPLTWAGYGGYYYAQDAPPEVQDAKARLVWAGGAGCSHWNAC